MDASHDDARELLRTFQQAQFERQAAAAQLDQLRHECRRAECTLAARIGAARKKEADLAGAFVALKETKREQAARLAALAR